MPQDLLDSLIQLLKYVIMPVLFLFIIVWIINIASNRKTTQLLLLAGIITATIAVVLI